MEGKLARSSYSPFLRRNASRMFTDKFFVFVMGLFRLFPLNVKNKSWKDLRISLHAHHFLSFSGGREIRAYRDVIARWNDKLIAFSRVTSVNAERESSVGHGYVIERFELMPFHKPNKKIFFARYIHTFSTKNRSIRCHREEELFVTSFTQCLTVKCFFFFVVAVPSSLTFRGRLFEDFSVETYEIFYQAAAVVLRQRCSMNNWSQREKKIIIVLQISMKKLHSLLEVVKLYFPSHQHNSPTHK